MVFHRKTDPAKSAAKSTAVTRPDSPVAQHLAAQSEVTMSGHNSGLMEESLIGSDLSIEGQSITIRCKGSLRVNGNIQADLHSRQLEVGREAIVTGSITADAVEVHGRVNGAILSNKVVLHSTAEVEGDVAAQFLSIEQGASFDGRSRRVRDPSEIAPQTEPVTAPTAQDRPVQSYQPQTSGYSEHLNGSSASKTTPIYS
jgi:cytoskeletal protein CcmA (bactofilin family)